MSSKKTDPKKNQKDPKKKNDNKENKDLSKELYKLKNARETTKKKKIISIATSARKLHSNKI
jgi:hypothetical protein